MASWKALRKLEERIRFIQVRHEESAAFMACGYAKFTGRLGVCIATSGPGAIHLLNGLYDAKMDGAPVLAITGQTYHDLMGMHYQQEVNLLGLFQDVTVFNQQINGPVHAQALVDAACRTALGREGVAHLNCPNDWQDKTSEDPIGHGCPGAHVGRVDAADRRPAGPSRSSSAAACSTPGRRTVIMVGHGARVPAMILERIADMPGGTDRQIAARQGGRPRRQPLHHRRVGLLGTLPSEKAMEECDSLLMVGTSFPYMAVSTRNRARRRRSRSTATRPGSASATRSTSALTGDAPATLTALLPLLRRRQDRSFLEKAQERMKEWKEPDGRAGTRDRVPMKPQVVAAAR